MMRIPLSIKLAAIIAAAFAILAIAVLGLNSLALTSVHAEVESAALADQDALCAAQVGQVVAELGQADRALSQALANTGFDRTGAAKDYLVEEQQRVRESLRARWYADGGAAGQPQPFILLDDGTVLLHPRLPVGDRSLARDRTVRAMLAGSPDAIDGTWDGGDARLHHAHFVPWGWLVGYAVPMAQRHSALARIEGRFAALGLRQVAVVTGIALLVCLFLTLAIRALVIRPIQRTAEVLRAVAAGDYAVAAPRCGDDEIGDMAASLETTVAALRRFRDDIVARLEGAVVQKTAALTRLEEQNQHLIEAGERAEAGARAKGAFLATMSHEIRTPLNGMIGMLDVLRGTQLSPDQQECLAVAMRSSEALLNLLNDILDFSKIEAGRLDLERMPFNIRSVLYEVADLFRGRTSGRPVELIIDVESESENALGDPGRLRQILTNLVGNALKFTPSGHVLVLLNTTRTGDRLDTVLTVQDTGIGISPAAQTRLFIPFTQAEGGTARRYGGTGLGLTICQRLVELMGGSIELASELGVGTTVTVRIPFGRDPDSGARLRRTSDPSLLDGRRILVVDDQQVNREIICRQLGRFGAEAVGAASGTAGLVLACAPDARPFDAAIIDLMMPGMDGFAFSAALRAEAKTAGLRLVMLSSAGSAREIELASSSGIAAFLLKPCPADILARALATAIDHRGGPILLRRMLEQSIIAQEAPPCPAGLRVLLVEDNEINRRVSSYMLKHLGQAVTTADDGRQALDAVRGGGFDLILMDCLMPEMDGYEATTALRREGVNIPILALSANALAEDRQRCLDVGMDEYLSKPLLEADLSRAIARWAGRKHAG